MTSHPWLVPSGPLVAAVARAQARAALRELATVPADRLGARAAAWAPLLAALPGLLRADSRRVLDAVGRVDVSAALRELAMGRVDADRLERVLLTLWLGIAGHPGLAAPLVLPGPFRERVVDPNRPRLLVFGDVRGLAATAGGAVVIGRGGRLSLDEFVAAELPAADGTVIVDDRRGVPDPTVAARVQAALALVRGALPGEHVERVTIGAGDAAYGEARVGPEVDAADLVASAQAAFVRAAAALEPAMGAGGVLVEAGRRLAPLDVLARACGNGVALPWRATREAATAIVRDLDDLAVLVELTPAGAALAAAVRALAGGIRAPRRHALLVNLDADDFVYSFQFGRSVERCCAEGGLRVDRIAVDPSACGKLAAELGQPIPPPVADGTELLMDSEGDPAFSSALPRLSTRHYEVVVANVRPRQFFALFAAGLLAVPTLLWDRHLHGGLREEAARRGFDAEHLRGRPIRAWSLADRAGQGLHRDLAAAGLEHGSGRAWPMDLEFFRSTEARQPGRLFAGGDNGRDWSLFAEAIRDLPFAVQLVTAHPPAGLSPQVRVERRLPLCGFRDAIAAASIMALPLQPDVAAGVTVLPIAMALGTAVVATRTIWTEQYVRDGKEALLVPPGDARAFREALVRLHEQPDLRAHLVANARRRVAELCDLDRFTREMFATLASLQTR